MLRVLLLEDFTERLGKARFFSLVFYLLVNSHLLHALISCWSLKALRVAAFANNFELSFINKASLLSLYSSQQQQWCIAFE
jgi:hypothetical protein